MEEFTQSLSSALADITLEKGMKLIFAIIILIVGFKLISVFIKYFKKSKLSEKLDPLLFNFMRLTIEYSLKIVLVVSVATMLGVPMTSLITILGSIGLTVGLALQGSLSNIAGGFLIFTFKPFTIGDFITYAGHSGTVEDIDLFYTRIITLDNRRTVIPNGSLSNDVVINSTAKEIRRVDMEFSVDYSSDLDAVHEAILSAAKSHELVLADPAPMVYLKNQADSALVFELRAWCKTPDYRNVYLPMSELVKRSFDRAGISVPFPQLDVHFDKNTVPAAGK